MNSEVVWTELDDLQIPNEFKRLSPISAPLDGKDLGEITYFVPPREGLPNALSSISLMPKLRTVQLTTAGYEDALYFVRPGLTICNARGVHDAPTAELAIGLTIAALRGIPEMIRNQMNDEWIREERKSLTGCRIGILGFGSIGRMIKRNLDGFLVESVAFSRSGAADAKRLDELDSELPNLDVVIIAAPLNSDSHKFFNARRLALMKDGALLVNIARGPIIDTDALVAELNSGRIQAVLDVTDPEPLPKAHPLWSAKGVLISPHVGGFTNAFEPRFRKLVEEQLRRLDAGEELMNIVSGDNSL